MKALLLTIPLLLASCERGEASAHGNEAGVTIAPTEVVAAVSRPIDTSVHLQGELFPYESVAIYPRVQGFLETISVDRASVVHRGQVLARLAAPELSAQRAEAEARTRSDQSTFDRLQTASHTPGVVAQNDVEVARASVDANRSRVRALRDLEQYLVITAPFDGVVTERDVHPGALVGPNAGTPIVRIEQVQRLRLTVAVPENYAGEILDGATARFTVRAWPGRRFTGTIVRPSHAVDRQTRTMAVELDVDNADGALAPGMYADVEWPIRRSTPSTFVPRTSFVQTAERTFVVRIRGGIADQVVVQRGLAIGDLVEIRGDVQGGDLVARRGNEGIRSGSHLVTQLTTPDGGR
jgi:RND family efflux transporter MFP subunit